MNQIIIKINKIKYIIQLRCMSLSLHVDCVVYEKKILQNFSINLAAAIIIH